jgi:hypothetical protein
MKACSSCPVNMRKQCRLEFRDGVPPCARSTKESRKTVRSAVQHRQPAISALADKWCDLSNQPVSVCAALYQFTTWAQKQQAGA